MATRLEGKYVHKTEREKRRARRRQERRWRDIRRRIGGCVIVLGFPLLITGGIILIVSGTNHDTKELPPALDILGPLLTALAFLCFIVGAFLVEFLSCKPLINCLIPDDPKQCPLLFKLFRGQDQSYIDQQAALKSLQSVPQKSAMRKPPNPDAEEIQPSGKLRRGVTFSDGDADDALLRKSSTSSDQPDQVQEETKSSSSLLSLRNCKIYPRVEDETVKVKDTAAVYTVSRTYFDIPVSTKFDDDVFKTEDIV